MLLSEFPSRSPIWNAAGTLGFAPPRRGPVDVSALGAFVTNPISRIPRTPSHGARLREFPGGALFHTGLPNPGLRQALLRYAAQWSRASLPVIVHVLAETPEDVSYMVLQLEEVEGVAGIELGLPSDTSAEFASELIQAGMGELPLIVRFPLNGALPHPLPGVISFGPPRGAFSGPVPGSFVEGRLFGPSIFPQLLGAVRSLSGIFIVAGGGVYYPDQAEALLKAGASAIQLDLRLWREPWPDQTWEHWLQQKNAG
jgi:dihydroorotate dehydrogenase (NAD+) catalytic subunit